MFKKWLCLCLAVILAFGVCSCSLSGNENTAAGDVGTPAEIITEAGGSTGTSGEESGDSKNAESSTASANKKSKSTSGKQTTSKKKSSGENGATTKKQSASKKQTTTKKQTTSKKQTTTKRQTTTKKQSETKKNSVRVSLTINCSQAVGKVEGVPSSGLFLSGAGGSFSVGSTVYDALCGICSANGVSVTASNTIYGMYVSAIGGLAEKEAGKMSGWTYTVNGKYPPKACDKYVLSDGDNIVFIYKAG